MHSVFIQRFFVRVERYYLVFFIILLSHDGALYIPAITVQCKTPDLIRYLGFSNNRFCVMYRINIGMNYWVFDKTI